MKLVTNYEHPPIPWRKFDWVAFDYDQMSGICSDPECNCRMGMVRGWGETEEEAIHDFVRDLLAKYEIDSDLIAPSDVPQDRESNSVATKTVREEQPTAQASDSSQAVTAMEWIRRIRL